MHMVEDLEDPVDIAALGSTCKQIWQVVKNSIPKKHRNAAQPDSKHRMLRLDVSQMACLVCSSETFVPGGGSYYAISTSLYAISSSIASGGQSCVSRPAGAASLWVLGINDCKWSEFLLRLPICSAVSVKLFDASIATLWIYFSCTHSSLSQDGHGNRMPNFAWPSKHHLG